MRVAGQSRSPAFTLVEVLAVIVIVAVLLAILLPTLSGTWTSASLNIHRSNMRECLNSISMYSESFRSHYPFMGVVGRPELGVQEFNDLEPPGAGLSYNAAYFSAHSFHWPTAVVRAGFRLEQIADPDPERRRSVLDRYDENGLLGSAYQLTHAAVAAPRYWLPGPVPEPTAGIFKPMRTDQLRFPSSKGMLLAMRLGVYDDTDDKQQPWILVGMGDNSVSKRENPAFANIGPRPYAALDLPVLTTEDGFEGRDF